MEKPSLAADEVVGIGAGGGAIFWDSEEPCLVFDGPGSGERGLIVADTDFGGKMAVG